MRSLRRKLTWADLSLRPPSALRIILLSSCIGRAAVAFLCVAAATAAQETAGGAGRPEDDMRESGILAEFEVERSGGALVIPVGVEPVRTFPARNITLQMLVDTGATATVFDTRHRVLLGEPTGKTRALTASGDIDVLQFTALTMHVGDLAIRPSGAMACLDMRSVARAVGVKIDGIVGMDFLRQTRVSVDFDLGKLRFCSTVSPQFGRAVPIYWGRGTQANAAFVRGSFPDGTTELFNIDSGSIGNFAGGLSERIYARLLRNKCCEPFAVVEGFTAATNIEHTIGTASRLTAGGYSHDDLMFVKHIHTGSSLGCGYLRRYSVAFDFPKSVMYLRPGKAFHDLDSHDLSGLDFVRGEGGSMFVVGAYPDTPASRAGLLRGDKFVAIDGQKTALMSRVAVLRLLGTEGRHVCLVHRRNTELEVVLHLRRPGKKEQE